MTGPKHLLDRLARWSALLPAAMPVLGMRGTVLAIGIWLLLVVARATVYRPALVRDHVRWWLLLSAPFLMMGIDLLRADALLPAWHIVERSAALLVLPTAFFLLRAPADARIRAQAVDVFTLAALALCLYVNVRLVLAPELLWQHPQALFGQRYRAAFGEVSGIHPPFAAYYFAAAIVFQVHVALKERRHRALRWTIALVLTAGAGLIGSRMPLLAIGTGVVLLLLFQLPTARALRAGAAALGTLVVISAVIPTARERIAAAFQRPAVPTAATLNDVNIRGPIARCSLELLERHWVFGMGQSHVQPALDACYTRSDLPQLANGSYSTHCQPLHWWIAFGLVGLAAFLLLFGAPMREAIRRQDGEAFAFLVVIALCCLTENLLARQWGVVLFAYFNTLFLAARRAA